ncbi:ABC transporter permease [Halolactibacillus alkaliphilus]|uniref:ABC transporter permease n=1 Tax=Halolactibacillus alkaliphilus TaxID=442899 RepID=A0A511X3I5_9BACI|nr:ABC transporter permease [Halolactibacillus alkaliphilus]GEN57491.1 ABC transporter permease [Halolactibacillus alkaliphilus]GGN74077.1 ABC transporter permease [Halolactibacillus alkaliphilus]SFO99957.1 putative ABC transport system permease protein [Halolactibacillus alkaliphilus]
MFISMFNAVESGIIFAIMALGVYLSFRILDFPDLTVDGSFVTGAAVSALLIVNGMPTGVAIFAALLAGFIAGSITGLLNTKGKVNPLLSGILMMTALYSINLRIMGQSNIPLLNQDTFFTQLRSVFERLGIDQLLDQGLTTVGVERLPSTYSALIIMLLVTFMIKFITDYFLKTEVGLALRAIGDNEQMIRSFSANTDHLKVLGLGVSNGLVALSGGLYAQFTGFSDLNMGIGMIVIGLASVIIGESIVGTKTIGRTTLAVVVGAVIYRMVITLAIRSDFLDNGDTKLITALLVVLALVVPKVIETVKESSRKRKKRHALNQQVRRGA